MRIALISNSTLSFGLIDRLLADGSLCGLATGTEHPQIHGIFQNAAQQTGLPFVLLEGSFLTPLENWIRDTRADAVFVITFGRKIPPATLALPELGFYNFHTGLLPERRGPDPIFWSIRERDPAAGLTIHQMDADFDTGPILLKREIPAHPDEIYSTLHAKIARELPDLGMELVEQLKKKTSQPVAQPVAAAGFQKFPGPADLLIDWNAMSTEAIKALVQAANPAHGGAIAFLRGQEIRILQVGLARSEQTVTPLPEPGTIVAATPEADLIVFIAGDSLLRIDVLGIAGGIYSGGRLTSMLGLKPGERFLPPGAPVDQAPAEQT